MWPPRTPESSGWGVRAAEGGQCLQPFGQSPGFIEPRDNIALVARKTVRPESSPMKAKGIGELGLCGVAAAVANAVYNATGVRVRDYPVTLDKLLERMPEGTI